MIWYSNYFSKNLSKEKSEIKEDNMFMQHGLICHDKKWKQLWKNRKT